MTPRMLAVRALMRQEMDGYANLVLDAELKRINPPMDPRDTAFAASIFYSTLEHQNLIDFLLNGFCKKSVAKLDAPVRAILRAGLAQARFMNVPLPAAVNESVKLTKQLGKTSAAGMVNAVLRRAAVKPISLADFATPLDKLCVYYSMSWPVAELLYKQYGDEALAMADAFTQKQKAAVRVNTLRTTDEKLAEMLLNEGCTVAPGPWLHCLLVDFAGSPAHTQAFREGLFHVQGLASQYAALSVEAMAGDRVLDMCAAPGGKTLTLAEMMEDKGELISGEGVKSRVSLIASNLKRCGINNTKAIFNDASVHNSLLGTFDRILCDVPCSGLGVLGKKPDIRYKTLENIEDIYDLQQKILQNGAKHLARNGRLVYSTCTVNYYENQGQVSEFLDTNKEFAVVPTNIEFDGAVETKFGTLFLPHKTGTDGFFVSILQRKE